MLVDLTKYVPSNILNSITIEEKEELNTLFNPNAWAEDRLGWIPRDYQEDFFGSLLDNKQIVLRWGRRLGKSDSMIISGLYFADTQYNIDPKKGSYRVLVICPYENQIDAFFDRMKVIVQNSPKLADSVEFFHHKFVFSNGSVIIGKTAGSKSNKGAASLRGQGADLIIFDEVDYMNDKEIMNIMQLKKEDPKRIRVIASSTPTGDRKLFYRWCTESHDLGWYHLHRSSLVSKEILEVNPDNKLGLTYLEEIKQQLTEVEFLHEVMAEFGENQRSLFQKRFLDKAIEKGKLLKLKYATLHGDAPLKRGPRILGVDWDKSAASTNMVVLEFNKAANMFYPIIRVEIPSHEFTYTEAIEKIIMLNDKFDLDWIYVDRGYGEKQIEDLKMHGVKYPHTGLTHKVVGIQFSQKIECRDPHTKQKVKKDVKPFMVNNAVNVLEKELLALVPEDYKVIRQLSDYSIRKVSTSGKPMYTEGEEHIVDCICLALLGFEQHFGALFNLAMTARIISIKDPIDDEEIHSRDAKTKPRLISLMGATADNNYRTSLGGGRRSTISYSRRQF